MRSALRLRRVVQPVAVFDRRIVTLGPGFQLGDHGQQVDAHRSEHVRHLDRSVADDVTENEPVPLQMAQGLRQHLLRHALKPSMQVAEALRSVGEIVDDQDRPFFAESRQQLSTGTGGEIGIGKRLRHGRSEADAWLLPGT
jgi:hypothetical protein